MGRLLLNHAHWIDRGDEPHSSVAPPVRGVIRRVPSAAMRRSVLPALALALALTACGGGDSDDEAGAPTPTPPASSSGAAPVSSESPAPVAPNERGNVPGQLGVPITVIPAATSGEATPRMTMTIKQIAPDVVCDQDDDPAVNGHYVGLEIEIDTSPQYDPRGLTTFREYDFTVLGADGNPVTKGAPILPDESNAPFCLDPTVMLTNFRFPPGQEYTGWLVLDLTVNTGTLVYRPDGAATGWEWQF
jgi:hypothetical protein